MKRANETEIVPEERTVMRYLFFDYSQIYYIPEGSWCGNALSGCTIPSQPLRFSYGGWDEKGLY